MRIAPRNVCLGRQCRCTSPIVRRDMRRCDQRAATNLAVGGGGGLVEAPESVGPVTTLAAAKGLHLPLHTLIARFGEALALHKVLDRRHDTGQEGRGHAVPRLAVQHYVHAGGGDQSHVDIQAAWTQTVQVQCLGSDGPGLGGRKSSKAQSNVIKIDDLTYSWRAASMTSRRNFSGSTGTPWL